MSSENNVDDFGRSVYAEQILKSIEANRSIEGDSSFIFGISGHWGEGKTHLLKLLEKKLLENSYTVVWFSPWKYAEDKQSLMRKFINLLNDELPIHKKVNLEDFEKDKSSFKIKKGIFVLYSIAVFVVILFKFYITTPFQKYIPDFSGVLAVLAIPVVTALIGQLIAFQNSQKAIATIDGFDKKLDEVLKKYKSSKKKLVVFVDDLDRVSDSEARDVLNALRTFFDKPQITYIVTGDNKILEGAVGKTLTEGEPHEQAEEGRRFLKKIFNVYWRMPLPAKWQIEKFIENKLDSSIFPQEEKVIFVDWMTKYFELNPRNIERFIESIKFNITTLTEENDALTEEEVEKKEQMKEVLDNKLLLARALIIQEKAYPLFERIAQVPSLLIAIEKAIYEGGTDLSGLVKGIQLTTAQISFLGTFMQEKPRFYDDGGPKVRIDPFFKLVAEIGLSDERGVSVDNFEKFLTAHDSLKIAQWLSISSNLDELVTSTQQLIDAETTIEKQSNLIKTVLNALEQGNNSTSIRLFLEGLGKTINTILKSPTATEGPELYKTVFRLLSKMSQDESEKVSKKLAFIDVKDFELVKEPLGRNATICVLNWVKVYKGENLWDAIKQLEVMSPFIEDGRIGTYFQNDIDDILNSFAAAPSDIQEMALNFLKKIPEGVTRLKAKLAADFESLTSDQQTSITDLIIKHYGKKTWKIPRAKKWLSST